MEVIYILETKVAYLSTSKLAAKHKKPVKEMFNILLEKELVEKEEENWMLTKKGESIGGIIKKHFKAGECIAWDVERIEEILIKSTNDDTYINATTISSHFVNYHSITFRDKFEATYRTMDGHYVRSRAEVLIDNWLYMYGIVHAYERKLPIEQEAYCNFYLPFGSVYIEYWGLENDAKYRQRKERKLEIYKENGFNLIEIQDADIKNLDDILPKKAVSLWNKNELKIIKKGDSDVEG